MMTLFDDDYILEAYVKDYAKEVERDTEIRKDRETAIRMIKDGDMSLEKIARYVPTLSVEELKELKSEVMQSA